MEPTPDAEVEPPEPRSPSDWALRAVLPTLVAVLFIGVLIYERGARDVDLRVYAPAQVSPGAPIPVRAFVFEGVGATEVPRIVERAIAVGAAPLDPPAEPGTPLARSRSAGVEGALRASEAEGEQLIYLVALQGEDEPARVQRRVQVTRSPAPSERMARVTTSAREYELGPLRAEPSAPSSLRLDARVPSGVCVPEAPCELLVWVSGNAPVQVEIEPSEGVAVLQAAEPTTGIARLVVRVQRLEATLTLRATLGGQTLARRALQLPMAPGGVSARVDHAIVAAGQPVRLQVEGVAGPAPAAVNVYRGGHWVIAASISGEVRDESDSGDESTEGTASAPSLVLPALEPGVHHVQAQPTPFDAQGAGVALVCAYAAGDTPDACLVALAGDARVRARDDAFAAALRSGRPIEELAGTGPGAAELAFRFMAHEHARDLYALPFPSSGLEQIAYGVDERVSVSRVVVAVAMLLIGLVAASIVLRRAREGANLADAVLREAGVSDAERHATRGRMSRSAWLSALAVLAAFVVVAMMVLSRGM